MMKKLYTFLIALFFVGGALGQTDDPCESCLPDGITFETQAQIDSFQINYPNCTEILGWVLIGKHGGSDITNLNELNVITSIDGPLWIGNWSGAASYYTNPLLTSLTGLQGLTFIGGDLSIRDNDTLASLTGLEGLTFIGGDLKILKNNALTELSGLDNVTSIERTLLINDNDVLTSLTGLDNLNSIGWDLSITDNDALYSLTGLENLTTIGIGFYNMGLYIYKNANLGNLSGLDNVTSIEGGVIIQDNNLLTSLTGLDNLTSIQLGLYIQDCPALTSLSGIDNIDPSSLIQLGIINNASLSECEVMSVCEYLASSNGDFYIYDNATGCNSPEEVLDSCEANAVGIPEQFIADNLSIYPNPAHATITIELPTQPSNNTTLTLSNTNGQQLIIQAISKPQTEIDISHLPVGIYIVKVWNDKDVMVRKVIRK